MEFAIVRKIESGLYFSGPNNSAYLMFLLKIFTDGPSFSERIKRELISDNSRGLYGNMTEISIEGNTVFIQYAYGIDSHTEPIAINKHKLIEILDKGLTLMKNEAPYVVLTREDEYSPIVVTDQLPNGMELFKEGKQTKALYKGKKY